MYKELPKSAYTLQWWRECGGSVGKLADMTLLSERTIRDVFNCDEGVRRLSVYLVALALGLDLRSTLAFVVERGYVVRPCLIDTYFIALCVSGAGKVGRENLCDKFRSAWEGRLDG